MVNFKTSRRMPSATMSEVELFDIWGIDFIGLFLSYYRNKYILVDIDYVSKWVEVMALVYNKGRSVEVLILKRTCSLISVLYAQS